MIVYQCPAMPGDNGQIDSRGVLSHPPECKVILPTCRRHRGIKGGMRLYVIIELYTEFAFNK